MILESLCTLILLGKITMGYQRGQGITVVWTSPYV